MLSLYFSCVLFASLWFAINKVIIAIVEKIASKGPCYTNNEIQQMIFYATKGENLSIRNDRYYSYDKRDNVLRIKEKQEYTEYDRFVCFHELGHYFDSHRKYRCVYNVITACRTSFIVLWFLLITMILGAFQLAFMQTCIRYVAVFEIVLGGLICFSIVPIELHASKQALLQFSCANSKTRSACRIAAYLSVVDQVLFWIMIILPSAFLFHFSYQFAGG